MYRTNILNSPTYSSGSSSNQPPLKPEKYDNNKCPNINSNKIMTPPFYKVTGHSIFPFIPDFEMNQSFFNTIPSSSSQLNPSSLHFHEPEFIETDFTAPLVSTTNISLRAPPPSYVRNVKSYDNSTSMVLSKRPYSANEAFGIGSNMNFVPNIISNESDAGLYLGHLSNTSLSSTRHVKSQLPVNPTANMYIKQEKHIPVIKNIISVPSSVNKTSVSSLQLHSKSISNATNIGSRYISILPKTMSSSIHDSSTNLSQILHQGNSKSIIANTSRTNLPITLSTNPASSSSVSSKIRHPKSSTINIPIVNAQPSHPSMIQLSNEIFIPHSASVVCTIDNNIPLNLSAKNEKLYKVDDQADRFSPFLLVNVSNLSESTPLNLVSKNKLSPTVESPTPVTKVCKVEHTNCNESNTIKQEFCTVVASSTPNHVTNELIRASSPNCSPKSSQSPPVLNSEKQPIEILNKPLDIANVKETSFNGSTITLNNESKHQQVVEPSSMKKKKKRLSTPPKPTRLKVEDCYNIDFSFGRDANISPTFSPEKSFDADDTKFVWDDYLESCQAIAAPSALFKHVECSLQNGLKKGMVVEVANKNPAGTFWVSIIVMSCGQLLMLKPACCNDDDSSLNFWCDMSTCDVKQIGWCLQTGNVLAPPADLIDKISKDYQLLLEKLVNESQTPSLQMLEQKTGYLPFDQIEVGMYFEVQHQLDPLSIWFVQVVQNLGGRLLLHYSCDHDHDQDFWLFYTDLRLHPIGWCRNDDGNDGLKFAPPKYLIDKYPTTNWLQEQEECYKVALNKCPPSEVFKDQDAIEEHGFEEGWRLEMLDEESSTFHVAHVARVVNKNYFIIQSDAFEVSSTTSACFDVVHDIKMEVSDDQAALTQSEIDPGSSLSSSSSSSSFSSKKADAAGSQETMASSSSNDAPPPNHLSSSPSSSPPPLSDGTSTKSSKSNLPKIECCHFASTNIFPMNWCKENGFKLQPVPGYQPKCGEFDWDEYLQQIAGTPASPDCFFQPVEEDMRFEEGMKLEVVNPNKNNQLCAATIDKVICHLLSIKLDHTPSVARILPWDSHEIFPIGWCESNNYPLKAPTRKMLPNKEVNTESSIKNESERYLNASAEMKNCSSWCSKIYFNTTCYSGPYLHKSRLNVLPKSVGPGPVINVMTTVLTKLIGCAYKSSRVLRELQLEGPAQPNMHHQVLRTKYKMKNYSATVDICMHSNQIDSYCRDICKRLLCCPNLISTHLYPLTCPENCLKLARSKHYHHFGEKKRKIGRPRGGHSNIEGSTVSQDNSDAGIKEVKPKLRIHRKVSLTLRKKHGSRRKMTHLVSGEGSYEADATSGSVVNKEECLDDGYNVNTSTQNGSFYTTTSDVTPTECNALLSNLNSSCKEQQKSTNLTANEANTSPSDKSTKKLILNIKTLPDIKMKDADVDETTNKKPKEILRKIKLIFNQEQIGENRSYVVCGGDVESSGGDRSDDVSVDGEMEVDEDSRSSSAASWGGRSQRKRSKKSTFNDDEIWLDERKFKRKKNEIKSYDVKTRNKKSYSFEKKTHKKIYIIPPTPPASAAHEVKNISLPVDSNVQNNVKTSYNKVTAKNVEQCNNKSDGLKLTLSTDNKKICVKTPPAIARHSPSKASSTKTSPLAAYTEAAIAVTPTSALTMTSTSTATSFRHSHKNETSFNKDSTHGINDKSPDNQSKSLLNQNNNKNVTVKPQINIKQINHDVPKTSNKTNNTSGNVVRSTCKRNDSSLKLLTNPEKWDVKDVVEYIKTTDCSKFARIFKEQEIDGRSLLLLDLPTVQFTIEPKLGPAVKLCDLVENIKGAYFKQFSSAITV